MQEALSGHHAVGAEVQEATRETHKRSLGGISMGYLLDLSETAGTGCDCTEQAIKDYLWDTDWGANPEVSKGWCQVHQFLGQVVTSALIDVNPVN